MQKIQKFVVEVVGFWTTFKIKIPRLKLEESRCHFKNNEIVLFLFFFFCKLTVFKSF